MSQQLAHAGLDVFGPNLAERRERLLAQQRVFHGYLIAVGGAHSMARSPPE
jgi:hypothetical protein